MRCSLTLRRLACFLGIGLGLLSAQAVELRDDRGARLVLPASPQRIITLLPSLTESVCVLGACNRLVGTDRFSNWPLQVQSLPKLGGLDDMQVERIVALRPDVVLVEPSARVVDRLESLGLKVVVLEAKSHADVKRILVTLGRLLDQPQRADAAWERIEAEMTEATRRVPARQRGQRVYFEVDAAPYAAGPGSFIGETLTRLGLANIVPASLGAFPRLNPEFVVQAGPDIVIAVQASLADMPARPGWAVLSAFRQGRSCGFPQHQYDLLVRPGPRVGEGAQLIARCVAGLSPAP
jgi:iron complex transport system substrate-binding protein